MIDRQLGKEFSKTGYTKTKRVALWATLFLLIMIIDLNYYLAAQISISNWISGNPRAVI